jgi:hypothetical protein
VRFHLLLLALFALAVVAATPAAAQMSPAPVVSAMAGNPPPARFVGDQPVVPRSATWNPNGVSYADCIQDMHLVFTVNATNFDGSEDLEVWATASGDCSVDLARGVGGDGQASCWRVNPGLGAAVLPDNAESFDIRVQDLVGPQNAPSEPPSLVSEGPSACTAQPSFVAVPMEGTT